MEPIVTEPSATIRLGGSGELRRYLALDWHPRARALFYKCVFYKCVRTTRPFAK
jgi:hypothetical protein